MFQPDYLFNNVFNFEESLMEFPEPEEVESFEQDDSPAVVLVQDDDAISESAKTKAKKAKVSCLHFLLLKLDVA